MSDTTAPEEPNATYFGNPWPTDVRQLQRMAYDSLGMINALQANYDRPQRQVDAVRAETLREAADEVHREARWQQEIILRGQGQHIQSVGRLLVVESILLNRAAALDAVQSETETGE